jgi:hypothetical protein
MSLLSSICYISALVEEEEEGEEGEEEGRSLGRILKILKKRFLQEGFCFVYHFSTRI